ncbi:hypothetical protein F4677DRAFT_442321 [Hypoxylon crocopeplum]|nr:hypothetical protein F4677DRAFT_442321 [Hypoxylon crocopeplum]
MIRSNTTPNIRPTIRVVLGHPNMYATGSASAAPEAPVVQPTQDPGLASSPSAAIGLSALGIGMDSPRVSGSSQRPLLLGHITSTSSKAGDNDHNNYNGRYKKKGFRATLRRIFGKWERKPSSDADHLHHHHHHHYHHPLPPHVAAGRGILVTREVSVSSEPACHASTSTTVWHDDFDGPFADAEAEAEAKEEEEEEEQEEQEEQERGRVKLTKEKKDKKQWHFPMSQSLGAFAPHLWSNDKASSSSAQLNPRSG